MTEGGKPSIAGGGGLGVWWMTVVIFGITTTLHGLSPLATYGLGSIFFLFLAVAGFLIPAGFVAVHLAMAFREEGGVFLWVGEAFGTSAGFFATWLQWLQNLIFWTVILTGSAAMLAIGSGWSAGADNKWFVTAVVLGSIWLSTLLTARGLGATGALGWIGSLLGTVLPGIALVLLALWFLFEGHPSHLRMDPSELVPDLRKPGNLGFAISTIMIFAGIELMGARIREMRNPARHFPRAVFLAIGLTVALLVPVVLSIAVLVPRDELNIAAGLVQAVQTLFPPDGIWWWVPAVFAFALLLDALGEIGGWMAGTPISMAAAGRAGYLPARLGERRKQTAPAMLLAQAIAGSLVSVFFLFTPGIQSTFWVLSALLVQLYVLMYVLLFAAAWRLRNHPLMREAAWKVPGGHIGLGFVCLLGGGFSVLVFCAGFFRPASLHEIGEAHYLAVLSAGLVLSLALPAFLILRRRTHATPGQPQDEAG